MDHTLTEEENPKISSDFEKVQIYVSVWVSANSRIKRHPRIDSNNGDGFLSEHSNHFDIFLCSLLLEMETSALLYF